MPFLPQQGFTLVFPATANPYAFLVSGIPSSIVPQFLMQALATSFAIEPENQGIVPIMELYAPGTLGFWPDNVKPQYRIPLYATTPYVPPVPQTFPALNVAF